MPWPPRSIELKCWSARPLEQGTAGSVVRISMLRAGGRVTGDAIQQLWRSHRRGGHPSMRVVPIILVGEETSNEGHAEVGQVHGRGTSRDEGPRPRAQGGR